MNRAEIQYALDRRNYVSITEDSSIDGPIQLGHLTGKVHIIGRGPAVVSNDGNTGRHGFEFNYLSSYTHDPPEIYFEGINYTVNVDYSSFFRVVQPNTSPAKLDVRHCEVASKATYGIDCLDGADIESVVVENCQMNGGNGVRWHLAEASSNDFIHILSTRIKGGGLGRVGPGYNLKNCRNATMRLNINELSPDLFDDLVGVYEGPIGYRLTNPRGRNVIDDFWFEPWGSWSTVSPNCFGFELRNDDTSGNYDPSWVVLHANSFAATGLSAGVELAQFYGGHSSANAASMIVLNNDYWKPSDGEYAFGGKLRVIFNRATDNTNMDDAIESTVNGIISGSWRDPLGMQNSTNLPCPGNTAFEGSEKGYASSALQSAWVDEVTEYDEGLI